MCILMPIKCFLKYLIARAIEGHLLFKVGFRVVMTGDTQITTEPRMTLTYCSSSLHLAIAEIPGMCHSNYPALCRQALYPLNYITSPRNASITATCQADSIAIKI